MRRLGQVRAQTDLVALGARHNPQSSLFAGQVNDLLLQRLHRRIAISVVNVIVEGGVKYRLVVRLAEPAHSST